MKNRIPPVWIEGNASRQAHCDLPDGTYEREVGRDGFFGPSSHIHHSHPPTGWTSFDGPLRPRAYDLTKLSIQLQNPWEAPLVLSNSAVQIRLWATSGNMDCLVSNADGDQVLFVHQGSGHLYCDYGHLEFRQGDYLLIPRSTMWRLECDDLTMMLMIESTGAAFGLPDKGPIGQHAIFDPAMLDHPQIDEPFKVQYSEQETIVSIKRRNSITTVTYSFNPLDAVGWHGDLTVQRLNWRDIRPIMSARYHLAPSAHTTWLSDRLVICTFCPRHIESDPGALKLPFYHSNNDYDEFIFYHQGQFFSRDHMKPGMCTYHPAGFPHGPHPAAYRIAATHARKETDEVAVMVDTRDPLQVHDVDDGVEWRGYVDSWKG